MTNKGARDGRAGLAGLTVKPGGQPEAEKQNVQSSARSSAAPALVKYMVLALLACLGFNRHVTASLRNISNEIPRVLEGSAHPSAVDAATTVRGAILAAQRRASTGARRQSNKTPVRSIKVVGERNSGTNFLEQILARALPHYGETFSDGRLDFANLNFGPLGGKHMFRHGLLTRDELQRLAGPEFEHVLWLLAVRSPCDWGSGMYRRPWHLCPPVEWLAAHRPGVRPAAPEWGQKCEPGTNNQYLNPAQIKDELNQYKLSRFEFWKMPWIDWQEARWARNFSYANIFHLRTLKETIMLQLMTAVPERARIVHLQLSERSPEQLLRDLVLEFNLTRVAGAPTPRGRPHSTECLTDAERSHAVSHVDWDIEAAFGFVPGDCRVCLN